MSSESDRELDQLYRAGAREEPPAWLDASILTASRAEAKARRTPGASARWQAPFALAAVLVLALSLALLAGSPSDDAPAVALHAQRGPIADPESNAAQPFSRSYDLGPQASNPSESGKALESQAPVPPVAPRELSSSRHGAEPRAQKRESAQGESAGEETGRHAAETGKNAAAAPSAAQVVPTAPPASVDPRVIIPSQPESPPVAKATPAEPLDGSAGASARPEAKRGGVAEQRRPTAADVQADARRERMDREASAVAPKDPDPRPAAQPSETASAAKAEYRKNPEQWLRDIEQLHREGRSEQAREQLDEFRKRFPGYPLPPALR